MKSKAEWNVQVTFRNVEGDLIDYEIHGITLETLFEIQKATQAEDIQFTSWREN